MCVRLSVCVFVISGILGTGRCSATLLSPTWRASPGELHWLVFESVRKKKSFRTFSQVMREPCSLHYNDAILQKLVVFLRRVELFHLQLGRSKEERLRCVESFAIAEWKLWSKNHVFHQGGGEETSDSVRRSENNLLPHTKALTGCTKRQCS